MAKTKIASPEPELTPDQIRTRRAAEKAYGRAIFSAVKVYETELARLCREQGVSMRGLHARSEELAGAVSVVTVLGSILKSSGATSSDYEQFDRILAARHPPFIFGKDHKAAVVAAYLVTWEWCEAYLRDTKQRDLVVSLLPSALSSKAHKNFALLRKKRDEIPALLNRYSTGKGRKPKKGEPSKLGAAGVLVQLNEWSRKPLGELTASSVFDYLRENRNTTP